MPSVKRAHSYRICKIETLLIFCHIEPFDCDVAITQRSRRDLPLRSRDRTGNRFGGSIDCQHADAFYASCDVPSCRTGSTAYLQHPHTWAQRQCVYDLAKPG